LSRIHKSSGKFRFAYLRYPQALGKFRSAYLGLSTLAWLMGRINKPAYLGPYARAMGKFRFAWMRLSTLAWLMGRIHKPWTKNFLNIKFFVAFGKGVEAFIPANNQCCGIYAQASYCSSRFEA
jgi:hypothetical protein